jgi:hypothetical protein
LFLLYSIHPLLFEEQNMKTKLLAVGLMVAFLVGSSAVLADPPEDPVVIRFEDNFFWCYSDFKADAWVLLGVSDVEALCAGEPDQIEFWDLQWVLSPSEQDRILENSSGDMTATVYPLGPNACTCDFAGLDLPLATGTVHAQSTDNNLFGTPSNATNAWGVQAAGATWTAGGTAQLSTHFRCIFNTNAGSGFCKAKINLDVTN